MSSLSGLDKDDHEKTNLIVNYLPQNLTDEDFHKLFSSIGPVVTTRVIRDRETGYRFLVVLSDRINLYKTLVQY